MESKLKFNDCYIFRKKLDLANFSGIRPYVVADDENEMKDENHQKAERKDGKKKDDPK